MVVVGRRSKVKSNSVFARVSRGDRIFHIANIVLWLLILLIIIYPLYFVVISSFSDPDAVFSGQVTFWPVNPSLMGYEAILNYSQIWRSYLNSIVYTVVGTLISVSITMMAAYALTHKFPGKTLINFIIIFTMFFSGGLIPTFLVMRDIGLFDTPWILILMGGVSVWNLMVARTFISTSIPKELLESAYIDGANHFKIFIKVILPLSSTIIAVLCVFYAVGRWNDFFTGLVFIRNRDLLPLQTVLREILATLQINTAVMAEMFMGDDMADMIDRIRVAQVVQFVAIVISTVPAIILYIFMQDYFKKGVMIGSIKG